MSTGDHGCCCHWLWRWLSGNFCSRNPGFDPSELLTKSDFGFQIELFFKKWTILGNLLFIFVFFIQLIVIKLLMLGSNL